MYNCSQFMLEAGTILVLVISVYVLSSRIKRDSKYIDELHAKVWKLTQQVTHTEVELERHKNK